MDQLAQMRLFARVVETGSFSRAAKAERVGQSTASKQIAALEDRLGAQLLRRTPRGLSVTDQGRAYYDLASELLSRMEAGEAKVRAVGRGMNGRLRVSTSPILAKDLIVPRLPDLFERFPNLSIDLDVSERYVSLVAEGFDVAIRVGRLPDTTLIAKKIGCLEALLVASPDYLAKHDAPRTPDDLNGHTCLPFVFEGKPKPWQFRLEDELVSFSPAGRFQTNDVHSIYAAVLGGLGISQGPSWLYGAQVRGGALRALLPTYAPPLVPIYAVSAAGRRQRSAAIKGFIDYLAGVLGSEPDLRKR